MTTELLSEGVKSDRKTEMTNLQSSGLKCNVQTEVMKLFGKVPQRLQEREEKLI